MNKIIEFYKKYHTPDQGWAPEHKDITMDVPEFSRLICELLKDSTEEEVTEFLEPDWMIEYHKDHPIKIILKYEIR